MNNNTLSKKKRCRKSVSLQMKLEVLKRFEAGARAVDIGRALSLMPTTVRSIVKNCEKIKEFGQLATPSAAVQFNRSRSGIMIEMERLLASWIKNQTENNIPCSLVIIQEKARSLYEDLKKEFGEGSDPAQPFLASRGWFERFKRRANLRNIAENGVNMPVESSSCSTYDKVRETITAETHTETFSAIVQDGGYTPQQVFNVEETGLFWKRMVSGSYVFRDEKFKASNDCLTVLLGGNAAGDFKLKPLLVYHCETPRALQGYPKSLLPVIWKSNKKSVLTQAMFVDWFTTYFCPAVKDYCLKSNLPNKALLVLDTSPGHPTTLDDLSENVKVVFLPSNAASLVQPMDQGAIAAFRAYYLHKMFSQAIRATLDSGCSSTLHVFLKDYTILNAIDNISAAWDEVTASNMNAVWRNLWPDCVQDPPDIEEQVGAIQDMIVDMGRQIGLSDLEARDVQTLLAACGEDLSSGEDLMEMDEQMTLQEEEDDGPELPPKTLTVQYLGEAMQHLEAAMAIFDEHDPDRQRSTTINRGINNLVNCYRELYREKKKATAVQLSLDKFVNNPRKKVLFASSVLNLAELVALRPDLSSLKKVLYFHENQLAYPLQKSQQRDYQYGYNQILSSLVADHVVFNSHYNMNSFLGNVDRFIRQTPDKFTFNLAERIKKKSSVIYVPLDFSKIQFQAEHSKIPPDHLLNILSDDSTAPKCLCDDCKNPVHIVWPHRWEHDKGPVEFFEVMYSLKNLGVRFQISVLGESFSEVPEIFDSAKEILKPYIKHWGFCKDKGQYYAALVDADVCVSTAIHEFFGVAMLEAVYAKCYPLCPKRLVYEEIYPDIYLYNTTNQLLKKLRDFCEKPHLVRKHKSLIDCNKYTWEIQGKELLQLFNS